MKLTAVVLAALLGAIAMPVNNVNAEAMLRKSFVEGRRVEDLNFNAVHVASGKKRAIHVASEVNAWGSALAVAAGRPWSEYPEGTVAEALYFGAPSEAADTLETLADSEVFKNAKASDVGAKHVEDLIKCGVKVVVMDFDQTAMVPHTYGAGLKSAAAVAQRSRVQSLSSDFASLDTFVALLKAAKENRLQFYIASFGMKETIMAYLALLNPDFPTDHIYTPGSAGVYYDNGRKGQDGYSMPNKNNMLKLIAEKAGVAPSSVVLIDDDGRNTEAAAPLGYRTFNWNLETHGKGMTEPLWAQYVQTCVPPASPLFSLNMAPTDDDEDSTGSWGSPVSSPVGKPGSGLHVASEEVDDEEETEEGGRRKLTRVNQMCTWSTSCSFVGDACSYRNVKGVCGGYMNAISKEPDVHCSCDGAEESYGDDARYVKLDRIEQKCHTSSPLSECDYVGSSCNNGLGVCAGYDSGKYVDREGEVKRIDCECETPM